MMGYYFDTVGDYTGALWFVAILALIGALLVAIMSPYPEQK